MQTGFPQMTQADSGVVLAVGGAGVLNFISPSDRMKSSCWLDESLIQQMFCSRESTKYLILQQNEKSTQYVICYA